MNMGRWPRTDVGTVVLHWVVLIAVVVLLMTGLRFSSDDIHHLWLRDFDAQLWSENLWQLHMIAGYALTVSLVVYANYLARARLFDRIRVNAARMQALFGTPKSRWSSIHVLMSWAFLIAAAAACVTGWLTYYGLAGPAVRIHLLCSWVILTFPVLHVLALLRIGGVPHLARILRPKRTEAAPEEVDLANVVSDLLAEKRAAQRAAAGGSGRSR
ncbi:MAG: cytochrome b/b6 domain-containing protein [bacterium]